MGLLDLERLEEAENKKNKPAFKCFYCGKFRKWKDIHFTTNFEYPQYIDDAVCKFCLDKKKK